VSPTPLYEVYALKFAEHPGGARGSFFFGPIVDRATETVAVDYFFWLLRSADATVVVDLGFTREVADRRKRSYLRSPEEALADLGVSAADVPLVILSHLHYDHAGCWAPFTNARFVIQDAELAFWTGRFLSRRQFAWLVELDDLQAYLALNHEGRVRFVDGTAEVLPGVTVVQVGGHTPGSQVVQVATPEGPVVLASDSCPLYENLETDAPFGILTDVPGSLTAFDRIAALAGDPGRVVPGHDPAVLSRFQPVSGSDGLTVRVA
jgi:glyoxylase-like metal-dependent hydrolase (beta-lactamase superfamily II)